MNHYLIITLKYEFKSSIKLIEFVQSHINIITTIISSYNEKVRLE